MIIGLLECDHVAERFRHIAGDYREMFAALFSRCAPDLRLEPFNVCNGELPHSIDACDAFLCTGSRYSAYDSADWINSLKRFVRLAYSAEKPFIGICFGHQILAEALGGKVTKAEGGWGVGVHNIDILLHEKCMVPQRAECRLQFMHQDQVVSLPEDCTLLGKSDHCPIAMFRAGQAMIGIQAHPEFVTAYGEALLLDRIERIGENNVKKALGSLSQVTDEDVVTKWIAEIFNLHG